MWGRHSSSGNRRCTGSIARRGLSGGAACAGVQMALSEFRCIFPRPPAHNQRGAHNVLIRGAIVLVWWLGRACTVQQIWIGHARCPPYATRAHAIVHHTEIPVVTPRNKETKLTGFETKLSSTARRCIGYSVQSQPVCKTPFANPELLGESWLFVLRCGAVLVG